MKGRCYSSICLDLRKPVEIRTSISQLAVRSVKGKGKSKVHPRTGHEGPEGEYRYSSTLSLTLALNQGGWSTPRPGRFTPGIETRYPLYRRLGGPQGRSRRPHLASWLRKEYSYTSIPLWAFMACSRVTFTFMSLKNDCLQ